MEKKLRLILSGILTIIVFVLFFLFGNYLFSNIIGVILISIAILIIVFSFILETFFTKPADVTATSISIILLLIPQLNILKELNNTLGFVIIYIYLIYVFTFFIISTIAQILLDNNKPSNALKNKISLIMKRLSETFANSKILYFVLSLIILLGYTFENKPVFLTLLAYFLIVYLLALNQKNIQKLYNNLFSKNKHNVANSIGYLLGTKNDDVYNAEIYTESQVELFDTVIFKTNIKSKPIYKGLVIDKEILNESERIDILKLGEYKENLDIIKGEVIKADSTEDSNIVGLVEKNTDVSKILFRYIPKINIEVGDVLSINIDENTVLYQVTNGKVDVEKISKNDFNGFIIGEAIQIGVWNNSEEFFDRFGWTPEYNKAIFKYNCENTILSSEEFGTIGIIPNTNYKIKFNYEEGIKHHLAILGVTGCGKSYLSRKMIKDLLISGKKVIAVDFTNEYKYRFENTKVLFNNQSTKEELMMHIEKYNVQMSEYKNKRDPIVIDTVKNKIKEIILSEISAFLSDDEMNICILEYPEMSNSVQSASFLEWFFKHTFKYIKYLKSKKEVCIVLEEAHTIVPEWNSVAGEDAKVTTSMINTISQIALQGRKYDVGFIVIAQRTANVSKTVLTQCNSIIAFQQFDNTSKDFLSNHLSDDMTKALPFLKKRHAIVSGKGFASTSPVIIRVPEIEEEEFKIEEKPATDTDDNHIPEDLPF